MRRTWDAVAPEVDTLAVRYAIIYLRLSDFRDGDDEGTFTAREDELRELAAAEGLVVLPGDDGRVIENDTRPGPDGQPRRVSASAFKTPKTVKDGNGVITRRTNRKGWTRVLLALQERRASVLIAGGESRLSREWRDALDLLDVCESSRASVLVPDEDGKPKWLLTRGGTKKERSAFMDGIEDARKYSEALSVNITKGRRRWAGKSYSGGTRPFGYRPDLDAPEHHKNLLIVPAEAKVLAQAADDILDRGISLNAIARDLREADPYVPTATGTTWSATVLRDLLSKPTVAGLAVHRGELKPAPWEPVIPRDRWEDLVELFESRKTGTSNEPRWLVSLYATCGVCQDGTVMRVTGSKAAKVKNRAGEVVRTVDRRSYVCSRHGHLRRDAHLVDELVAAHVVARLERDAPDLLKPRPKVTVDAGALRAEAKRLRERKAALARVFAADGDEGALASGVRVINDRLTAIDAQLATSDEADPLPEFRNLDPGATVLEVWDSLGVARQRAIVQLLYTVEILPRGHGGGSGGNRFDPDTVKITPRTG